MLEGVGGAGVDDLLSEAADLISDVGVADREAANFSDRMAVGTTMGKARGMLIVPLMCSNSCTCSEAIY